MMTARKDSLKSDMQMKSKNKRPDRLFYTPKPKLVAQSNKKEPESVKSTLNISLKHDTQAKSIRKKSPQLLLKDSSNIKANKTQSLSKEIQSKSSIQSSSVKYIDSYSTSCVGSWADIMEEYDLSDSRSMSDDRLCNGHIENTIIHSPSKENYNQRICNRSSIQRSNKEDCNERHRVQQLSVPDLIEQVKIVKLQNEIQQGRNSLLEDKGKIDKKKRCDLSIRPRFQKNKSQNHEILCVSPTKYDSSDLLKLPDNFIQNLDYIPPPQPAIMNPSYKCFDFEIPVNNVLSSWKSIEYCSMDSSFKSSPSQIMGYIPPPQPAVILVNGVPDSSMSLNYFSLDSSFIASPNQSMGYIAPPQPAVKNPSYMHLGIPVNSVPDSSFNMREAIAPPVQCPAVRDMHLNAYNRSPICFGEISPVQPEPGKKRLNMIVEKNLKNISLLERELSSLIAKGFSDTNLNALRQCRLKLESCYENIILDDPKYCAEKNPEDNLWKSCYHQIIEMLRRKPNEKERTISFIFEGTVFYENLMKKQQETYDFNLTRILEYENMNVAHVSETIRIVLISTQKILIYLGDLARYKEQVNQTANYGKARSWYSKAQQIDPKNGRPYHQLANLAFIAGRKLDAVYYYIRSLAAINPILSAKESLLSLFEEAKKKYEQYDENINKSFEVWIKPDESINQKHAEMDKNLNSSRLKKMSDVELNKRFITSFLHVHGILFTKVGMETFSDTLNHMLKKFYFLLQRSPLASSKLLRLLAINIFSVGNCSMEVHTSRSE